MDSTISFGSHVFEEKITSFQASQIFQIITCQMRVSPSRCFLPKEDDDRYSRSETILLGKITPFQSKYHAKKSLLPHYQFFSSQSPKTNLGRLPTPFLRHINPSTKRDKCLKVYLERKFEG